MADNFHNSEIYKKALKEYQDKIYGEILKPLHVIVIDSDEVYLFYNPLIVNDIFNKLVESYNDDESDFPIQLGYETPRLEIINFMGVSHKAIKLWYDNCDLPRNFEARL